MGPGARWQFGPGVAGRGTAQLEEGLQSSAGTRRPRKCQEASSQIPLSSGFTVKSRARHHGGRTGLGGSGGGAGGCLCSHLRPAKAPFTRLNRFPPNGSVPWMGQ